MKIEINFKDKKIIEKFVQERAEIAQQIVIEELQAIGEECVNIARNLPSPPVRMRRKKHVPNYIDDSGNLRHSIGYLVAKNGEIITSDLRTKEAANTARNALTQHNTGIVLIMVAGMKYSYYVSKKGYDVLDSAIVAMKRKFNNFVDYLRNV